MLAAVSSPYVLGLVLAAGVTLALAYGAFGHRDEPASFPFVILCVLQAAWAATTGLGLVVGSPETRLFLERLHWVFASTAPVFWLAFALEYVGYGEVLTVRRLVALLAPSALFLPLLFTNPANVVWTSIEPVSTQNLQLLDQTLGPATIALSFYIFVLIFTGAGIVVRFGLTAGHLYRAQTVALIVAVAIPILVSLFSMFDITPVRGLNMTPYGLSASAVIFGYALFRFDFLDKVPSTRRFGQHTVTESLRDGVIVVDDSGRVVECNPVAGRVLDVDPTAALGEQISTLVPNERVVSGPNASSNDDASTAVDESMDGTTTQPTDSKRVTRQKAVSASDGGGDSTVGYVGLADTTSLRNASGTRRYLVERSPVHDQHDSEVGQVFVLRDVTETERREERLAVLNRVLRHNLRNDMNVVDGYAQRLADAADDGEDADAANAIRNVATDLVDLSLKARTVETVMSDTDSTPRHVDAIVHDCIVDLTDDYPDAAIDVSVPSVRVARSDVVSAVLSNVLENALEHATDDPTVTVTGARVDAVVEVTVSDDGPGIPEAELVALEPGEESALDHGSGLGLWIVAWGIDRLGGDVTVDVDDGTTITLALPVAGGDRDPDTDGHDTVDAGR